MNLYDMCSALQPDRMTAPSQADIGSGADQGGTRAARLPGALLALAVAVLSQLISPHVPLLSPLVIAIILGVAAANLITLPTATAPGLGIASKHLLRAGIVLLGLQLALSDIVALGAPTLLVVVAIVVVGILGTVTIGRMLRMERTLTLLIACGFSICGAAAVAAAAGVVDPEEEAEQDTVTAVALVVLFGSLMIAAIPAASHLLGLSPDDAGRWAGGSIHEIAQVVATGGVIGGGALSVAVMVKLARILMLAPVMAVLGIVQRRADRVAPSAGLPSLEDAETVGRRPPLVPLFVLGFLAMVLVRSLAPLPDELLSAAQLAQTTLLAAAMFALGCGVRLRTLLRVGPRPFALAALSTPLIAGTALAGVLVTS